MRLGRSEQAAAKGELGRSSGCEHRTGRRISVAVVGIPVQGRRVEEPNDVRLALDPAATLEQSVRAVRSLSRAPDDGGNVQLPQDVGKLVLDFSRSSNEVAGSHSRAATR
jgi:hypothetical protein